MTLTLKKCKNCAIVFTATGKQWICPSCRKVKTYHSSKLRRKLLVQVGKCVCCKGVASPNKQKCLTCAEKCKIVSVKYQNSLLEKGLCVWCRGVREPERKRFCASCQKKVTVAKRACVARWKTAGYCVVCGSSEMATGTLCVKHQVWKNIKQLIYERKKRGLQKCER